MRLKDQLVLYFCRLGVAGLDPKAPGTWGTAMACLLAPYIFLPLNIWLRAGLLLLLFLSFPSPLSSYCSATRFIPCRCPQST